MNADESIASVDLIKAIYELAHTLYRLLTLSHNYIQEVQDDSTHSFFVMLHHSFVRYSDSLMSDLLEDLSQKVQHYPCFLEENKRFLAFFTQ